MFDFIKKIIIYFNKLILSKKVSNKINKNNKKMFKIGDKIKVIKLSGGHNYTIGKNYIITNINYTNDTCQCVDPQTNLMGNYIYFTDIELISYNKSDIEKKIKKLYDDLKVKNYMIHFLIETNQDVLNINEFLSWYILYILKSDIKDKNKEIEISKILNNISTNINYENLTKIIR
jgi:hypothetical protein